MLQNRGGFLSMTFSVLGLVLFLAMFESVMTGIVSLYTHTHISTFTLFTTIIKIAPAVLLLAATLGSAFAYYKGYQSLSTKGGDAQGLLRIVFGALILILFVTLFSTVLDSFYTLYSGANASEFIAYQTVVQIEPAILFLMGIFGSIGTAVGGVRQMRRRRRSSLA